MVLKAKCMCVCEYFPEHVQMSVCLLHLTDLETLGYCCQCQRRVYWKRDTKLYSLIALSAL